MAKHPLAELMRYQTTHTRRTQKPLRRYYLGEDAPFTKDLIADELPVDVAFNKREPCRGVQC